MKIPNTSPEQFDLLELHALAADPDFKVNVAHAKKLGIYSFDQAQSLMRQLPLSNASIITLLAIARTHLLWISGVTSSFHYRLTHDLSDERLALLESPTGEIQPRHFKNHVQLLLDCVASLVDEDRKSALRGEMSNIIESTRDEREAASKIFPLLFSEIVPQWEKRASKELAERTSEFAYNASICERDYFSKMPPTDFSQGQTDRWIRRAIEAPSEHGLKHSAFSGTHAIRRLQTALLVDVISYDKEISEEGLPETLVLDVNHLQRMQGQFNQLLKAQCIADYVEAICGKSADRSELFKTILFGLQEGDEEFGLNLEPAQSAKIKSLLSQEDSPVFKIQRERLRSLLLDGVDKNHLDPLFISKWNCLGMKEELATLKTHLDRILQVHFQVHLVTYYSLMEGELEKTVMASILSNTQDNTFRNWLNQDEQAEAAQIQDAFAQSISGLLPFVAEKYRWTLVQKLQVFLLEKPVWEDVFGLLVSVDLAAQNLIVADLTQLYQMVWKFRDQRRKSRTQLCETEKRSVLPQKLASGFRL